MELEQLRMNHHSNAFVQEITNLQYSASIEEHQYWTQLGDHVRYRQQDPPMTNSSHRNSGQGQLSNRQIPPSQEQKRDRSSEEPSEPPPRQRRRPHLVTHTTHAANIHREARSASRSNSPDSGPSHDTGAAFETALGEASALAQSALSEIPYAGTITVSLDPWPPLEVRTRSPIPLLTVRVTITDLEVAQSGGSNLNMDVGALHAVVSLWSADGRVASPHAVPPLLTGRKDATLANVGPTELSERRAEATFSNLAITQPGHYRIRISIMETPLPGHDDDGEVSVGSPRQFLSIETRPIYAHGFAPLVLGQRSPGRG